MSAFFAVEEMTGMTYEQIVRVWGKNYADLARSLAEKAKEWGLPFRILMSRKQFDEACKENGMKVLGSEYFACGVAHNGTAYICIQDIIDYARDPRHRMEAEQKGMETLAHEGLAHVGMKLEMGTDAFNEYCDRVFKETMTQEQREEAFSYQWDTNMTDEQKRAYLDIKDKNAPVPAWADLSREQKKKIINGKDEVSTSIRRGAADEFIAKVAEKRQRGEKLDDTERNLWRRIVDWFRQTFGNYLTEEDIAEELAKVQSKAESGTLGQTETERTQGTETTANGEFGRVHIKGGLNSRISEKMEKKLTPEQVKRLHIENFTAKDEMRPIMECIYYKDGYAYASDSHILIKVRMDYPAEWEGKKINPQTGKEVDGKYPNADEVIEKMDAMEDWVSVSPQEVLDALKAAAEAKKGKFASSTMIAMETTPVPVIPEKGRKPELYRTVRISTDHAKRLESIIKNCKNVEIYANGTSIRVVADGAVSIVMGMSNDRYGGNMSAIVYNGTTYLGETVADQMRKEAERLRTEAENLFGEPKEKALREADRIEGILADAKSIKEFNDENYLGEVENSTNFSAEERGGETSFMAEERDEGAENESTESRGWLRNLPKERLTEENNVKIDSPAIVSENDFARPNRRLRRSKQNRYRLAAIKYAEDNHLFGEYTNNSGDNGPVVIQYDRKGSRRTKGGLEEILYNDKVTAADIESTAVIPQIIEKGIYLESANNRKTEEKPGIVKYHYYMCGLKIGDSNYVVAFNVAEQRNRKNRYYFHQLVLQRESESGNELAQNTSSSLVSSAIMNPGVSDSELTNRGETPSSTPVSEGKGSENSDTSKENAGNSQFSAEERRENMTPKQIDDEYFRAMEAGDEATMREMLNEVARRNGYGKDNSWRSYHTAPSRGEAAEDGTLYTWTLRDVADGGQVANDISDSHPASADINGSRGESMRAIQDALSAIRRGEDPTVTIYRAVPKGVEEGKVRNGDWVTMSRAYAEEHGRSNIDGDYRIIEEKVPASQLYWDGNDINEWGFDDGREYKYGNTENNRKLDDLVTRDDDGNVIPPSKRFDSRNADTRFSAEERDIIDKARNEGKLGLAPNGKQSNLFSKYGEHVWAMVRTPQFKKWFGDWEKATRIEKLRKSEKAIITGNEIPYSDDLKQYAKNALEYGKKLRGEYENGDTHHKITLVRGRRNGGVREVLSHDLSEEQIQSVAAIPQIIKNAIYIDSADDTKEKNFNGAVRYHYYICGLKIGGQEYTARMIVMETPEGDRFYDHRLTKITLGNLLDEIAQTSSPTELSSTADSGATNRNRPTDGGEAVNAPASEDKVEKIKLILQNNSSKVVDENGEPLVVYHGSRTGGEFNTFDGETFFIDNKDVADMFRDEASYYVSVNGKKRRTYFGIDVRDLVSNLTQGDYEADEFIGGGDMDMREEWDNLKDYEKENIRDWFGLDEDEDLETLRVEAAQPTFETFLNIRNPYIIDFNNQVWQADENRPEASFEKAREEGHDGMIIRNIVEGGPVAELLNGDEVPPATDYVTFSPNQIKSVDNNGDFSTENNDIRFSAEERELSDSDTRETAG